MQKLSFKIYFFTLSLLMVQYLTFAQLKLVPLAKDLNRNVKLDVEKNANARIQIVPDTVKPGISIEISKGYNPRCSNETGLELEFRCRYFNAGTNPTFEWLVNGVVVGNGTVFNTNTLKNNDVVYCKLTSNLSCLKPTQIESNKITIIFASSLTPSIEIKALDNAESACSATYPITFIAKTINAGSNPQISWFYNSTVPSGVTGNTYARDSMAAKNYVFATLQSSLSCALVSTTVGISNYLTRTTPRIISPTISIKLDSVTNPDCEQKRFNFTLSSSHQGTNPVFSWYKNKIFIQTTSSQNFYTNIDNNGDEIYVRMKSSIQCANPSEIDSPTFTRADTLSMPFFEDFVNTFDQPDKNKWTSKGGTYINNTYAIRQPSHNTATFDGLKYEGTAYDTLIATSRGKADNLTSLPIDLSGLSTSDQATTWLSFFWQTNGLGESPDAKEGDVLDLYFKNSNLEWVKVWSKSGFLDTNFYRTNIPLSIDGTNFYFHSAFQFKFENTGRLSGNFDIWNVDYIYLNKQRNAADTFFLDQAYSIQPLALFPNNYTSIPFSHFQNIKNEIGDNVKISSTYNNLGKEPNNNSFTITAKKGTIQTQIGASSPDITPGNATAVDFSTTVPGSFWQSISNEKTEIDFVFSLNGDLPNSDFKGINYLNNNNLTSKTILDNYYAYDDGTAEYGIGLNQKYSALLYQFPNLKKPDTLRQIAFHFIQTGKVVVDQSLNLIITTNKASLIDLSKSTLPANVLYNANHPIKYAKTVNNFTIYDLNQPVIINTDSFFVGYRQISDDALAVGWDKNTNNADKIFSNVGNGWVNYDESEGSLMIRPVFGKYNYLLSTEEEKEAFEGLSLYPMPVDNILYSNKKIENACLFDLNGVQQLCFTDESIFDLSTLKSGIYVIKMQVGEKVAFKKVIKL